MAHKPVVVLVVADSSQTGVPKQVFYLAQELVHEYQIHCVCPDGWLVKQLEEIGGTVHKFNNTFPIQNLTGQIQKVYRKIKPEIIHCHGVRGGLLGRLSSNPKHSITIYTEHLWTKDFHLSNRLREQMQFTALRVLARKTHHTVAVSEAVKQFLLEKKIAKAESTSVISDGVAPIGNTKPVKEPIIGSLGRLTSTKGLDILFRALPSVIEQFPALKCRIGGTGPELKSLKRLAKRLCIENQIEWLGNVTDEAAFYQSLQIYVQPARSEGFGMAPLEAMSACVPVVASSGGALPEVIEDTVSGLLFPSENQRELSHQLSFLLSQPDIRKLIREGAKKRAAEYSIKKMTKAHDELYQKLLTKNQPRLE